MLSYRNNYYVKYNSFETKQAIAVMMRPMTMINGVSDRQTRNNQKIDDSEEEQTEQTKKKI